MKETQLTLSNALAVKPKDVFLEKLAKRNGFGSVKAYLLARDIRMKAYINMAVAHKKEVRRNEI